MGRYKIQLKKDSNILSVAHDISLFLLFFVPPLVFLPGKIEGKWLFVNYTHPKLAAILILSILYFLVVAIYNYHNPQKIKTKFKKLEFNLFHSLFLFFIFFLAMTSLKAYVIEASIYEIIQYVNCYILFLFVSTLVEKQIYLEFILFSICISFLVVTILSIIQIFTFIPWLRPIESGANFPSTFGYKNPAALAYTGQWFLLAYLCLSLYKKNRKIPFILSLLLLFLEAIIIAALQSRTSYFAFLSTIFVMTLFICLISIKNIKVSTKNSIRGAAVALSVLLLATVSFAIVLKTYPKARHRLSMITIYLKNPKKYLECDRGVYLQNSIYMANCNLLGVGIGNWRFAYPLYRKVKPSLWFDKKIQVQKAHCDYAQMLGETGWIGLILWMTILGALFLKAAKCVFSSRSMTVLFLFAQYCAFLFLMMFDYCIQMPYHKFLFFTVVALLYGQLKKERSSCFSHAQKQDSLFA